MRTTGRCGHSYRDGAGVRARGDTVFATMRNPKCAPQLTEIAASERLPIEILQMDVDSDESVREGMAAMGM